MTSGVASSTTLSTPALRAAPSNPSSAWGVEPGHVYVSAVPSLDAVQGIGPDGSFGRNPDQLEGIEHLSGDTTGAQDHKNLFEPRYDRWWLAPTALGPLAVTDIPESFR